MYISSYKAVATYNRYKVRPKQDILKFWFDDSFNDEFQIKQQVLLATAMAIALPGCVS